MQEVVAPLAQWSGRQMLSAVRGIVSAYRQKGGSREEAARAVAPLAMGLRTAQKAPRFQNVEGGVRFTHTEAVPVSSGAMSLRVSSDSFSWLQQIAAGFEEYRIRLEFGYVPICPATTVGTIMMAWDYDPVDTGPYNDYTDYFNTADHCISSCWAPCAIATKMSEWLKTGEEGEARTFSPGVLKLTQTATTNGYTMVRYTVELRKAQPSTGGYAIYTGSYTNNTAPMQNPVLAGGSSALVAMNGTMLVPEGGGALGGCLVNRRQLWHDEQRR